MGANRNDFSEFQCYKPINQDRSQWKWLTATWCRWNSKVNRWIVDWKCLSVSMNNWKSRSLKSINWIENWRTKIESESHRKPTINRWKTDWNWRRWRGFNQATKCKANSEDWNGRRFECCDAVKMQWRASELRWRMNDTCVNPNGSWRRAIQGAARL